MTMAPTTFNYLSLKFSENFAIIIIESERKEIKIMAQENSDNMQVVMGIIMQAGNAKAAAMQAIQAAKKGDFDKADEFIKQANEGLVNAHNVQTDMLTQEAQGNHVKVDLYMVHAQDHLMTAITFIDLAKEVVAVYKKMAEK